MGGKDVSDGFEYLETLGPAAQPGVRQIEVVVKDIAMPFGSMVQFLLRWVLAAAVVIIIVTIPVALIFLLAGGMNK